MDSTTRSSDVRSEQPVGAHGSRRGSEREENREKNGRASLRPLKTRELNPDTCSKSWTRYGIVPTARRLGMTRKERSGRVDIPSHEQEEAGSWMRPRTKSEQFSSRTIII